MAAAKTKRIALSETDALFLPALVISLLTLFGWGAYVLSFGVPKRSAALLLFVLLLALWLVLAVSAAGTPAAVLVAFRQGLLPQVSRPWVALTGLIVLAGIIYRLASWPHLIVVPGGDGAGYDYMAATAATLHRFVLLVYRTPGYPFLLFWTYLISGVHNYVAVYAVQLVLAALTGILMMAAVLVATGRRFAALLALLIGMLWHPMAAASAYLMSELPAIFLSALTIALLVSLLSHRHVASSSLALGPSLALLYEVRPTMVLWALAAGLAALLLPYLRWRHRALLLGGAATILVPIALVNYASPYRALTPGTALELTAAVLGSDRFSLYLNAPNSPRLMEALYDSTITDGGGVDVWSDKPPAEWPSITRQRQSIIVGYIAKHLGETLQLSLRRAALLYRADQPWDYTTPVHQPEAWWLLTDVLLVMALVGAAAGLRSHPRLVLALGLLLFTYTGPVAFFHVEPRYGLPAYPAIAILAAVGLATAMTRIAASVRGFQWKLLAAAISGAGLLALGTLGMEAWLWPAIANDYAARPATGGGELASCYLGNHLPAAAAWQPGRPMVLAGGVNGWAHWDLATGGCQWQLRTFENFWDVEYSADGRRLALATHALRVVDGETGNNIATDFYGGYLGGTGTEMTSVSLDSSGRRLAFASTGLRFFGVQDLDTRTPLTRLLAGGYAIATRWSPSGTYLAASSSDEIIHLYDANLSEVQTVSLSALPLALAWSPSGDRLAVADAGGKVWIFQVAGPSGPLVPVGSFQAHNQAVRSLVFSPDGRAIATASSDKLARVWQAEDHRLLGTLSGHTATVWSISWSANGTCLLTAAADGSLKIWSRPGLLGAPSSVAGCLSQPERRD